MPSKTVQGNRVSSGVEALTSVCLSSSYMDHSVPTKFQKGSHAKSLVEAWNSTNFSRCKRGGRPPVELIFCPVAFSL